MGKFVDLTGKVFERLTVLDRSGTDSSGIVIWNCRCECGEEVKVRSNSLRSMHSKSCGCLRRERAAELCAENTAEGKTTHGYSKTRAYKSWQSMKNRCMNSNSVDWDYYGGRGITVCDEWEGSFEQFLKDMSDRPEGKTLDRIDSNLGYFPDNCRWATPKEQRHNRRDT